MNALVKYASPQSVLASRREGDTRNGGKRNQAPKLGVAAFIDALTGPARRADARTQLKLMQSAAGEKPKMWGPSIIGFGSYHYRYESGREGAMPIIAFSPRTAATVLYDMTGFSDAPTFLAELGKG
jgi:hypothetical protein